MKVTKGVQKTRDFEMTLLKAFQAYLKLLRSIATSETAPLAHGRCAHTCTGSGACDKLAVSHSAYVSSAALARRYDSSTAHLEE